MISQSIAPGEIKLLPKMKWTFYLTKSIKSMQLSPYLLLNLKNIQLIWIRTESIGTQPGPPSPPCWSLWKTATSCGEHTSWAALLYTEQRNKLFSNISASFTGWCLFFSGDVVFAVSSVLPLLCSVTSGCSCADPVACLLIWVNAG